MLQEHFWGLYFWQEIVDYLPLAQRFNYGISHYSFVKLNNYNTAKSFIHVFYARVCVAYRTDKVIFCLNIYI